MKSIDIEVGELYVVQEAGAYSNPKQAKVLATNSPRNGDRHRRDTYSVHVAYTGRSVNQYTYELHEDIYGVDNPGPHEDWVQPQAIRRPWNDEYEAEIAHEWDVYIESTRQLDIATAERTPKIKAALDFLAKAGAEKMEHYHPEYFADPRPAFRRNISLSGEDLVKLADYLTDNQIGI